MQKEYKILEVKLNEAEAKMNDMAKHGWEVVSTDTYIGGKTRTKVGIPMLIVFARETQEHAGLATSLTDLGEKE